MRNNSILLIGALVAFLLSAWFMLDTHRLTGTLLHADEHTAPSQKDERKKSPAEEQPAQPPKRTKAPEPLKPFKPSEEIRADQAVDFPYDI